VARDKRNDGENDGAQSRRGRLRVGDDAHAAALRGSAAISSWIS
jgi:hypothetical protein